jgi:putative hydrolase of HD superfamily
MELKEQMDLGNGYAEEWIGYAVQRLQTETAKNMAREIMVTDSTDWWFEKKTELWVNDNSNNK